jgi:hypothetical protein
MVTRNNVNSITHRSRMPENERDEIWIEGVLSKTNNLLEFWSGEIQPRSFQPVVIDNAKQGGSLTGALILVGLP